MMTPLCPRLEDGLFICASQPLSRAGCSPGDPTHPSCRYHEHPRSLPASATSADLRDLSPLHHTPVQKLVAKPDQLIKRRGKLGLVKVNVDFEGAKQWIDERMNTEVAVRSLLPSLPLPTPPNPFRQLNAVAIANPPLCRAMCTTALATAAHNSSEWVPLFPPTHTRSGRRRAC